MGDFDKFWGSYNSGSDSYMHYRMYEESHKDDSSSPQFKAVSPHVKPTDEVQDMSIEKDEHMSVESPQKNVKLLLDIDCDNIGFSLSEDDEEFIKLKLRRDLDQMGLWLYQYLDKLKKDYEKVYTYCGVYIDESKGVYSYMTDDESLNVGDEVLVPMGKDDKIVIGKIVSIGHYLGKYVPYPIKKTKSIIRKRV